MGLLLQIGGVAITFDPELVAHLLVAALIELAMDVVRWTLLGHALVAVILLPWIGTRRWMRSKSRVRWGAFVLLAPVVGAGLWLAQGWRGAGRPWWACRRCGYDHRGLDSGRPCPECGDFDV
jgi:hypothetical protein